MPEYLQVTPYYKIWIEVIDYVTPRSSFLIEQFNLAFDNIKCTREELLIVYNHNDFQLVLIFATEYNCFFCKKLDKTNHQAINWYTKPPLVNKIFEKSELQKEIDTWLLFLKQELTCLTSL